VNERSHNYPRRRGRLLVVSGPSGSGKGTLIREAVSKMPDVTLSVSATTRPARKGERNGVDYHFMTEPEFLALRDRGELLESARVFDHYYGTPREEVEAALARGRDVILELDIQGAVAVKRAEPEAVLIFVEPPSIDELTARLRGRGTEDADTLGRRIEAAYEEMKVKGVYDHIVVNDDLKTAVAEMIRILESSRD
jgi:guanylate kinase